MRHRPIAVGFVAVLLGLASPSAALQIDASYVEDFGLFGNTPDTYTFVNDVLSEANVVTLHLDLTTSASGVVFDPAGSPFTVLGGDAVGFDGNFNLVGSQLLTLNFSDFQPGETFIFGVETDDAGGTFTTGADFAGTTLETTFQGVSTVVSGMYVASSFTTATLSASAPVPEPATLGPVAVGLGSFAWLRRRRRR